MGSAVQVVLGARPYRRMKTSRFNAGRLWYVASHFAENPGHWRTGFLEKSSGKRIRFITHTQLYDVQKNGARAVILIDRAHNLTSRFGPSSNHQAQPETVSAFGFSPKRSWSGPKTSRGKLLVNKRSKASQRELTKPGEQAITAFC